VGPPPCRDGRGNLNAATAVIATKHYGEPQPIARNPAPTRAIANTRRASSDRVRRARTQPGPTAPSPAPLSGTAAAAAAPVRVRNAQRGALSADAWRAMASPKCTTASPLLSLRQGRHHQPKDAPAPRRTPLAQRAADRTPVTASRPAAMRQELTALVVPAGSPPWSRAPRVPTRSRQPDLPNVTPRTHQAQDTVRVYERHPGAGAVSVRPRVACSRNRRRPRGQDQPASAASEPRHGQRTAFASFLRRAAPNGRGCIRVQSSWSADGARDRLPVIADAAETSRPRRASTAHSPQRI